MRLSVISSSCLWQEKVVRGENLRLTVSAKEFASDSNIWPDMIHSQIRISFLTEVRRNMTIYSPICWLRSCFFGVWWFILKGRKWLRSLIWQQITWANSCFQTQYVWSQYISESYKYLMITKGSEEKNYENIQYDWLYNSYYFKQNLDHVKKI